MIRLYFISPLLRKSLYHWPMKVYNAILPSVDVTKFWAIHVQGPMILEVFLPNDNLPLFELDKFHTKYFNLTRCQILGQYFPTFPVNFTAWKWSMIHKMYAIFRPFHTPLAPCPILWLSWDLEMTFVNNAHVTIVTSIIINTPRGSYIQYCYGVTIPVYLRF